MSHIKKWTNKLSVRKKIIFYGYLTITPVLLITCIILSFSNYNKALNERLENDIVGLNSLGDSVYMLQKDAEDISTYICINNDVIRILESNNIQSLNKNLNLWLEKAPMQIVQDMISLKGTIKTIAIYPENGVKPYLRGMDGSTYIDNFSNIRKTDIYYDVLRSEYKKIWKSVGKNDDGLYIANRSDKIVLYREILNRSQKKKLGLIVIGVDKKNLEELCSNAIVPQKEGIIILDKNSGELFEHGKIPSEIRKHITKENFLSQNYKERENYFSYGQYEVITVQGSNNASIVCKIVPKYSLQMQIIDFAYMPIILLVAILIGMLPLLLIISQIITKPLNKLTIAINKFSKGDFEQKIQIETEDEIGEVARCFNKMVEDIKKLIDENYIITLKEKQSELAALQAQINPHFLYNTLDSFYWKANEDGNEELAENIIALSQLFRLVLNRGDSEITVRNEIELVSRYLQIQRMRFSKGLEYNIDIEDNMQMEKIPKLIVQPFVENAIVHGFENTTKSCKISVTGKIKDDMLCFEIIDTGIGMTQIQIDEIWEGEQETKDYARQRIGKYAIKNIKERLQIRYQDNFKLKIESSLGKGTKVILCIPRQKYN
ncbi:sensor histidine kinase [Eubacterium sp.]